MLSDVDYCCLYQQNFATTGTEMRDKPIDRLRHVYCNLSFWELHNVQRVHIEDYHSALSSGDGNRAEGILATINDLGAILEEREKAS